MKSIKRTALLSAIAAVSLATSQAKADNWSGNLSGEWTLGGNWIDLSEPGNLESADFNTTFLVPNTFVNLSASRTVASMRVTRQSGIADYKFTRTNNSLLTVTDRLLLNSAGGTLSNNVNFDGFRVNAGSVQVINNAQLAMNNSANVSSPVLTINDNARVTLNTSSTFATDDLTLSGPTPDIIINSGTLHLRGTSFNHDVLGGTLSLNSIGTIQFDAGGQLGAIGASSRIDINRTFIVLNNARLLASSGGDIVCSSFLDIGNGGVGRMLVDGAGSTVSAQNTSDWGAGVGSAATVSFQNSGAGTFSQLRLVEGAGGQAAVVVSSSAQLTTTGALSVGPSSGTSSFARITVQGGTLNANASAIFRNGGQLELTSGGVNFGNDATFSAGSTFTISGGNVGIASGRTFNVAGGIVNNTSGGAALGNGVTIRVTNGGRYDNTGFFDIANGNATGTLSVDGTGSRFTAGGNTDWGRNTGNAATATFSNSGEGTFSTLRVSDSGGASTVTLQSGGRLTTTTSLITGNASPLSNVRMNIAGGELRSNGTANFRGGTNVNLSSGTLSFNGNATFSTSANLNWTGGTMQIASGRTLMFDGGAASLTLGGVDLSDGATLRIGEFGAFESTGFVDVADGVASGTLAVDGVGARFRAGGTSDWGSFTGNTATATFSNFGVGTLNTLRLARFGGTGNLSVGTNATLTAAIFEAGSPGASALIQANSGTINVTGPAIFASGASVSTSGTGVLRLGGNSTFSTGSTFNGTSSAANSGLQWADGTTLAFDGGTGTIAAIGSGLPNNGTLRITNGGSFTANENFNIGNGTLLISGPGSKLMVLNTTSPTNFMDGGAKTVAISNGGAGTFAGELAFARFGGTGTINISGGGSLTTGSMFVGEDTGVATINIDGGALRSSTGFVTMGRRGGAATINITGGSTFETVGNVFFTDEGAVGSVLLNVSGGTFRTTGSVQVNGGTTLNFASGTVNIGGTLGVGLANSNARVLLTPGGDKVLRVGGLNIPAVNNGKVDLSDNDMIIDYTGASPLGTIRGFLNTGRNGGNWLGNGLTSSTAALNSRAALGLVEATQLGSPATFFGQPIDNTTLLTRYTLYGDGNIDGTVNITDFAFLAANFNVATNSWFLGDYNYDGTTNISDFALLASNFNLSLPGDLPVLSAVEGPRGSAVPEPSALSVLAAAVALQCRCRKQRSDR